VFEIGASLRAAREKRGLSREEVQVALRIRERYLGALEDERWELLPGEAYAKGFLFTYAEHLGLNGTLYVDEYNERIAVRDEQSFLPPSLAAQRRGRTLFRMIGAVIAAAALIAALMALSRPPAPVQLPPSADGAAKPPSGARPRRQCRARPPARRPTAPRACSTHAPRA
jgi:cytoskeletal protein RodZ